MNVGQHAEAGPNALAQTALDLVPLLEAEAADTERLGHLTDKSATALRRAGLLSLFAPREFGGHEAGLAASVEVFTLLGRACGSSAWVSMLLSGGSYLAAHLGDRARREVWGDDPTSAVCGGFGQADSARRVSGGLLVSGRWRPLSGIRQASWAIVGVPLCDETGVVTDRGLALFPMSAGTIEKSWHVAGMQGTGSDTLAVDEVFVPDHRILSFSRLLAGDYNRHRGIGSIYKASTIPFITATMAGPLLGMADAALDYTRDRLAHGKGLAGTFYLDAVESPGVRFSVADAAHRIDTARLHAARAVAEIEDSLTANTPLTELQRARVRMDVATTGRAAVESVRLLLDAGGSSSFTLDRPIQRIWRDLEVASRHQLIGYDLAREVYAHGVLGLGDPVTAMF